MALSERLQQLPDQFFASLVKKVNQKKAEGYDVINLGQGNPDQPTPEFIIKATQKALEIPENHKYSLFRGNPPYKQAAADFYRREYGVELDPEKEIAVLGGSKIGLVELPLAVMNPGETLLLPDPGYPDYLSSVALAQVKKKLFALKPENQYLPDYEAFEEDLTEAKLLYLNYPHNPTGAQATANFFTKTVAMAKKHQTMIAHDFAYAALGSPKPRSFLQIPGAKKVGVEFYTLSKSFNMAGWRVAFACGNAEIIEAINLIQDHLFVGLFPALQEAGVAALTAKDNQIPELNQLYQERRETFVKAAEKINWHAYPTKGAFYAWMPVPAGYTSETFTDLLLEKAHVAVASGIGFGQQGEGYVRIGLTIDKERLKEAVARIAKLDLF
ncbi:pyridoxal phosphate-dependent aminotransferase [Tetragenococcus koreensis]|nr:pyridoxal phosphate-dependent aminotransferase [Tetragenococcus koreensis]MDN6639735.1 pyridoxal phosphate-dependent aminotransferase [Tetragenococcus sp.]MDN6836134.1 pyridoxal phosphate-dependent aminotransferase [Lactococcus lactis]MCF1584438.1 pyridoxal phosphate-dependent aminotransferase [Tetragenococcus koreensis]MCF1613987.1 pyridoxal phosphate-dependent aminotransferase [Tetragenococcus koreensis]MCF1619798.1 pyridoxal phosphate-dependent aminotransferase [Tetragenococcus koreensis